MIVAPVAPSPLLARPALARPAAAFLLRTRLLPPGNAPAGFASQSGRRCRVARRPRHVSSAAGGGAVGDAFVVEGATNVKFPRELTVPGCTEPLIILGTGYRDKFFVKVYAAAFYVDNSIGLDTERWREKVGIETFDASSVFDSIFKAPVVKSLCITLVRDVDGKTFVKALDDVIARRIQKPTDEEESSLLTFRNIFLGRNLKQGTSIYLTWLEPSRMLVSISTDQGACKVDAEIKSATVNYGLYDGFFGSSPVSPTLRSSSAQLLEAILTNKQNLLPIRGINTSIACSVLIHCAFKSSAAVAKYPSARRGGRRRARCQWSSCGHAVSHTSTSSSANNVRDTVFSLLFTSSPASATRFLFKVGPWPPVHAALQGAKKTPR